MSISSNSANVLYSSSAILNQDANSLALGPATTAAAASGSKKWQQRHVMPFRYFLHPRQNSFTLNVPTSFCFNDKTHTPNQLYFSKLDVIPDFFNQASEALRLETVQEDNILIDFPFNIVTEYGPNQFFQEDSARKKAQYTFPQLNLPRADFVEQIITFFATAVQFQPAKHNQFNPLFLDWTYVSKENENVVSHEQLIYELVPNSLNIFYHELKQTPVQSGDYLYSWERHMNLPSKWKTDLLSEDVLQLPGINSWKFPRALATNTEQLRIRLHLQPFTVLTCSNFALLQSLGFDWEDVTIRATRSRAHNQFHVINSDPEWLTWTATRHPDSRHINPFRSLTEIFLQPLFQNTTRFLKRGRPIKMTLSNHFQMTKAQIADDSIFYETIIKQALSNAVLTFNLRLSCNVEEGGKITIPKPDTENRLKNCRIETNELIVRRLGYRPTSNELTYSSEHFIDRIQQRQQQRTNNDDDITLEDPAAVSAAVSAAKLEAEKQIQLHQKAREKAEILVYDTGAIHVTSKQGLSQGYNNFGGQFVASLAPKMPGIMTLDPSTTQYLRISECQAGKHYIPLTFQLNTFIQTDESILLNWPAGAALHGVLESVSTT